MTSRKWATNQARKEVRNEKLCIGRTNDTPFELHGKDASLYSDVYESLLAIYSSDDVDEMIANQFIVEFDALEKRIEAFVMMSIKDNMNLTNNEI